MSLTDADYNAFSTTLSKLFTDRAKGLDPDSCRIVNQRPADHILAGFLTPVPGHSISLSPEVSATGEPDDVDEELAQDLPKDSAYEQTAIGMEWIAPMDGFDSDNQIVVNAEFFVYIRRLPTFSEQRIHAVWRDPPRPPQTEVGGPQEIPGSQPRKMATLVPVWTRERISGLGVAVNLTELRERRRLSLDLSSQIREALRSVPMDHAYPGRRPLFVRQPDFASEELFAAYLSTLRTEVLPIEWRAVVDIRLSSVPTQPGCVRVALRLINHSVPPGARSLDYVDPNLYASLLRAQLPRGIHRPTIFQELPASFRYDRRMVAIGINAQVDSHEVGGGLLLETNSVPKAVVPRLEPREIPDAVPEFVALARNPLPLLQTILVGAT